ncbi:MAG: restriction endonuclease subunit R [Candidatus Taylorbacteria bacterium]|nr:restriction endonuclease subunit R [Candidatus Taylorbacteria bacterium]
MNAKANYIKQRLSLRDPLKESLDILADLGNVLELKKDVDLAIELEKVRSKYPTCTDFERAFPSICFSIATGVGKTRLMGACIAYLYLEKGIRNFFVLAPNLTIYEKLIKDFSEPTNPKYVFQGIAEFVHNRPLIITGDNYNQATSVMGGLIEDKSIHINIFNISKFNKESRSGRSGGAPRIKRLSEYLGESYWQYLAELDDLVILMDEAHRYHADSSKNAINELKPVLGIELTATPLDEKGNTFKNVVYEYSLAKALVEGKYVKNPAIAKRKNFQAHGLSPIDIERIKLEDAVSIHEDTKNELEIYARNNGVKRVKPFILVVCRDIAHAKEVFAYVNSDAFFNGGYEGKVLQIDSSTRDEEDIERQFISLDNEDNQIEIVIHVNMLKEGWDVTNLYTIAPLRAARAPILIEQTIGRGLRLPYNGERTGDPKVDKLTVLAHENFEEVIEAARDPNSILNKLSFIEIDGNELGQHSTVVTSESVMQVELKKEAEAVETIKDEGKRQEAKNTVDAKRLIIEAINDPDVVKMTNGLKDFDKPEVQQRVIEKAMERLDLGQQNIFKAGIIAEIPRVYKSTLVQVRKNIIEIPRMDLVQGDVRVDYEDFELNVSKDFTFHSISEDIHIQELTGEQKIDTIGVQQGALINDTPVKQVMNELMNYPEIDYEKAADLLFKLSGQAVAKVEEGLVGADKLKLTLVIRQYRKVIAGKIYDQIKNGHISIKEAEYVKPKVLPFVKIEEWNFTVPKENGYKDYRDTIIPLASVPKYVYLGFEKSCHPTGYKFQSNTEKKFAMVLEADKAVRKWLRPAPNQFHIYWANNSKGYEPDFVVETDEGIYLIETKAADEVSDTDVEAKKQAALRYCKSANVFTSANEGKPWKYLLIPHDEVSQTSSFEYFISRFTQP